MAVALLVNQHVPLPLFGIEVSSTLEKQLVRLPLIVLVFTIETQP